MGGIYEIRQLTVAAENAWTSLTENGISVAAPTSVPGGVSKLAEIWIFWASGQTGGVANMAVRLSGGALLQPGAVLEFAGPSHAPGGTNTVNHFAMPAKYKDLDIPVAPGQDLIVQASVNGADVGDSEVAVQLVFA